MKKTKILVPAAGLLLLGTAASVTGTVAWLSMNDHVTATGMQITAKTTATYLLIGSGVNDTASEIQGLVGAASGDNGLSTALSVTAEQASVLPSAHETIATAAAAATYSNWYTGRGTSPSDGTLVNDSKTLLAEGTFANYVIKRTVYLTVAVGAVSSGDITVSLSLTEIAAAGAQHDYDPVSFVFASESTVLEFNEANNWTNAGVLTTGVAANGVKTVDIYVYYDGNNADVNTNNFANLSGASAEITFTAN